MKKIFGKINLTYFKVVIMAIIIGIYTAVMAMLPIVKDTSFSDLTVTFEVWIFLGIFIIMNSKSAKDSALKCFIFFLISQPLVYLVQDIVNHTQLFNTYYRFWIGWTIATIPMGYIGYYMKKDKWWGLLILAPMLVFLGEEYARYLSETMFSFPRHLLTTIFCVSTLIIYPLAIFKNKIAKYGSLALSTILIIVLTLICIINPPVYKTDILVNSDEHPFNDSYKVYLEDSNYGNLTIKYEEAIEDWIVSAEFKKAGKTTVIIEDLDGKKTLYDITIQRDKYDINKKN